MAPELETVVKLLAATAVGVVIGINRGMYGKPLGMRTLALVSLGAAAVALATLTFGDFPPHSDALSRVVQGLIQGSLTGIGFIGAGVILHDRNSKTVHGLTTAATVWITAALGLACGLGAWVVAAAGTIIAIALLFLLKHVEDRFFPDNDY